MPSVGLRPVGAQVGEATWSFRCAGGSRSEWSWVAGPPDPGSLQPGAGDEVWPAVEEHPGAGDVDDDGWVALSRVRS